MPARKKTVKKKKAVYKAKKKSFFSFKKLLAPFLVLAGIAAVFLFVNQKSPLQRISSEDVAWQEEVVETTPDTLPNKLSENSQDIWSVTKTSHQLEDTGVWNGRNIRVVKDANFTDIFKASSFGMYSIKAMDDGRIFMGGYGGFALKNAQDKNWQNIDEYKLNTELLKADLNTVVDFVQALTPPGDVYVQGLNGVLRFNSEKKIEFVLDPTDSFGILRRVNIVSYPDSNGVIAFREKDLYFIENGNLRKWKTPIRSCGSQNLNDRIISAYYDQNKNKTYFLMKECQTVYLYDLSLSSSSLPLIATKLARLDNFPTINGSIQIKVGGKSTGLLYMTSRGYSMMWIVKNYDPNAQSLSFTGVKTPLTSDGYMNIQYNNFDIEYGESDVIWATQAIDTGSWWMSSDYAGELKSKLGNATLANTYTNDISVDSKDKSVYVSHKYLPGQFKSGFVTIIGENTPSPTPVKKCKVRLEGLRTSDVCTPTKQGKTKKMTYYCSDGYKGVKSNDYCTSTGEWINTARYLCSKRPSVPCK